MRARQLHEFRLRRIVQEDEIEEAPKEAIAIAKMKTAEGNRQCRQELPFRAGSGDERAEQHKQSVKGRQSGCGPKRRGPKGGQQSQSAKRGDKGCGDNVAKRSREPMFANDQHFPLAVLHVLVQQRLEGIPHMVPTADARRLVNLTATAHDAKVVFIILVADQFFIKMAGAIKNSLVPTAVNHGINVSLKFWIVRPGASDGKWGMKDRLNRSLFVGMSLGAHGAADIIGTRFLQDGQALSNVIGSVGRMGVHADDDLSSSGAQSRIKPS